MQNWLICFIVQNTVLKKSLDKKYDPVSIHCRKSVLEENEFKQYSRVVFAESKNNEVILGRIGYQRLTSSQYRSISRIDILDR